MFHGKPLIITNSHISYQLLPGLLFPFLSKALRHSDFSCIIFFVTPVLSAHRSSASLAMPVPLAIVFASLLSPFFAAIHSPTFGCRCFQGRIYSNHQGCTHSGCFLSSLESARNNRSLLSQLKRSPIAVYEWHVKHAYFHLPAHSAPNTTCGRNYSTFLLRFCCSLQRSISIPTFVLLFADPCLPEPPGPAHQHHHDSSQLQFPHVKNPQGHIA